MSYWRSGFGPYCEANAEICCLFIMFQTVQLSWCPCSRDLKRVLLSGRGEAQFFLFQGSKSSCSSERNSINIIYLAFMLAVWMMSSDQNYTYTIDSKVCYKIMWVEIFVAWKRSRPIMQVTLELSLNPGICLINHFKELKKLFFHSSTLSLFLTSVK